MLQTSLARLTTLLAVMVVGWALVRGRWPERIAAGAIGIDWAGSILFQDRRPHHHGQPVIVALDILQAAVLLGLVTRSRRIWVLWGAAFTTLLVFTHAAFALNPGFGQWSYFTVIYLWSVGLLLALAAGMELEGGRPATVIRWSAPALMGARPSTPSATARRRS